MSRSSRKAEGTGSIDMSCAARSPSASSSSISATGISGIGRDAVGLGCAIGAAMAAERSSSAPNSARTLDAVGSWSSPQTCTMTPAAFSTLDMRSWRWRLRSVWSAGRMSMTASTREPASHTSRSALRLPARCIHSACECRVGTRRKRDSGTCASTRKPGSELRSRS